MRKKEENLNTASGLRIAMILLGIAVTPLPVSYTHLDVYKRQGLFHAERGISGVASGPGIDYGANGGK